MITITLPWPDTKKLSPNARVHWAVKHKAAKEANSLGYWEAYKAWDTDKKFGDSIVAQYTLHPPDKRRRDLDNLLSSLKHATDGVFVAIGADDSCIQQTIVEWGDVIRGGRVTLRLEELENES
jgi:crossover junction endodeoxyribonuclease RusA